MVGMKSREGWGHREGQAPRETVRDQTTERQQERKVGSAARYKHQGREFPASRQGDRQPAKGCSPEPGCWVIAVALWLESASPVKGRILEALSGEGLPQSQMSGSGWAHNLLWVEVGAVTPLYRWEHLKLRKVSLPTQATWAVTRVCLAPEPKFLCSGTRNHTVKSSKSPKALLLCHNLSAPNLSVADVGGAWGDRAQVASAALKSLFICPRHHMPIQSPG